MTIALIVAAGKNNVIGKKGDLPWHFPSDLKFFKEKTSGHAVLMGRVTYQSILARLGKPLPGRHNIILTRDKSFHDDRITIINDLIDLKPLITPQETLFVIGGAQIYEQTLNHADIVYLTHIDLDVEDGDAFFPQLDASIWHLRDESQSVENGVNLRFSTYIRVPTA